MTNNNGKGNKKTKDGHQSYQSPRRGSAKAKRMSAAKEHQTLRSRKLSQSSSTNNFNAVATNNAPTNTLMSTNEYTMTPQVTPVPVSSGAKVAAVVRQRLTGKQQPSEHRALTNNENNKKSIEHTAIAHRRGDHHVPATGQKRPELARDRSAGVKYVDHKWPQLVLGVLGFRILNAFIVRTWFVPDEYWQSLEVAHRLTFGYGYMTWEWSERIRGYFYPMLFTIQYKMLALLKLDTAFLLVMVPRIFHAILAAIADLHFYKLADRLLGRGPAFLALTCYLTNWFVFYTATRTLTNSAEMIFTVIGLTYYPWPKLMINRPHRISLWLYLSAASISVMIRPTALVVWGPLCVWNLAITYHRVKTFFTVAVVGIFSSTMSLLIDHHFYGKWVFVPYNFLKFNLLTDQAAVYGTHPWHWYITQGLPAVLGPHLPLFLLGLYKGKTSLLPLLGFTIWSMFVYSLSSHKEFRFLLPVIPFVMIYCGSGLSGLGQGLKRSGQKWMIALIVLLTLASTPIALYTSIYHQKGSMDVMNYIHEEVVNSERQSTRIDVLFAMPCHSTPYYSHLHKNISMRFLSCPPPLGSHYNADETALFYDDPMAWFSGAYIHQRNLPTHIITFNNIIKEIEAFLTPNGYRLCAEFFNTHFPFDRVGSKVLVHCLG